MSLIYHLQYFSILCFIGVNSTPNFLILELSYFDVDIACRAVSLVIRGAFPEKKDLMLSILQATSFKKGVTLMLGLGLSKPSEIQLKTSLYFKFSGDYGGQGASLSEI